MPLRARLEPLRSLGFGSISGTYSAVGSAIDVSCAVICITNLTDADMIFSVNSSIAEGQFVVGAGGYKLIDLTANDLALPSQITLYVKQISAPTKGAVYLEVLYD